MALFVMTTMTFSANNAESKAEVTIKNTEAMVWIDCSGLGDLIYDYWTGEGLTHRAARAMRREFVRRCRALQ
ncbi:MAG: hypothetical protein L3J25_05110 [Flavobacteriaceae bacterium]|nr:hypothetical protein [Flavobacteriaceae bacterium]